MSQTNRTKGPGRPRGPVKAESDRVVRLNVSLTPEQARAVKASGATYGTLLVLGLAAFENEAPHG